MKCEAFRPGCTNEAVHKERGYWLCLDCVRSFAEYTPQVTTVQALAAYREAFRQWSHSEISNAAFQAAHAAARAAGASDDDLYEAATAEAVKP